MTVTFGLLALIGLSNPATTPPQATAATTADPLVVEAARKWLVLGDEKRWKDGYDATAASFRKLNTLAVWTEVSEKIRTPLGKVLSRTFVSQQNLPAPPHDYEVVKFRTRFANKEETIETVSLDREDGEWRVVGVTLD